LEAQVKALIAQVKALDEKLRKSSRNCSKPPSSDGPKERHTRKRKTSSVRKRGGQPGHAKHERPLVPPEEVSERIVLLPTRCAHCDKRLFGADAHPHRHQVFELPPVVPIVTEYVQHTLCCSGCAERTRAGLPDGVGRRVFGPSVTAVVCYFMGVHRLSKRLVADVLGDVFGLPISLGAVVGCQKEASGVLEEPYEEALGAAQASPIKNADETSWPEGHGSAQSRAWLWTMVTSHIVVFMIHASRAQHAAAKLLLNGKLAVRDVAFGYLGTDRHGGYHFWPLCQRQFCWSHLKRDFTAIAERQGEPGRIGQALLEETGRMFGFWHRVRDKTLRRERFVICMRPLRKRLEALLEEGTTVSDPKTARTCKKLLKASEAMWTFVRAEGVEPTNNSAERAVRHGVIYRKLSGGTQSEGGSRFVERILTVHATLRLQNRPILPFLQAACEASLRGFTTPSLLPLPETTQRLSLAA